MDTAMEYWAMADRCRRMAKEMALIGIEQDCIDMVIESADACERAAELLCVREGRAAA